jgi:hypothetical protein
MLQSLLPTNQSSSRLVRDGRADTSSIEDRAMKSKRIGSCLLCLLAAVTLGTVASPASADTTLRWKFTPGQKRNYVTTQKVMTKAQVMGQQVETTLTQTVDMTWEVKAVDKDGVADMIQTIDRVKLSMTAPQPIGNFELDTAKADNPPGPLAPTINLFRSMSGSPFESRITPRGELRDIKIPPKVVEAFKSAGPGGAMFNEDMLKNMFGQSLIVFPEGAIAEGKTWTGSRKMATQFGTMVLDITYTLEGASGPVQNIGVNAKVTIEPQAGSPLSIGVKSQETKGHCRFDNSAGKLNASDLVQKMSMAITAGGQEFTQDTETTTKMDLKSESGAK